jgi:hypothetical protein
MRQIQECERPAWRRPKCHKLDFPASPKYREINILDVWFYQGVGADAANPDEHGMGIADCYL